MSERRICPSCGSELPINAPQGLCPACLLKQGLESVSPASPLHDESPATDVVLEETISYSGMAASHATQPIGSVGDLLSTDAGTSGPGPDDDEGALEPDALVRYFGDYKLIRELGRGAMGIVYKARQISLNRLVALKMLRADVLATDDERRRFQNEVEAVALLDHPHIVPILEVGEHDGRRYFSMKLIGGSSLAQKQADYQEDPNAAARLVATAAEAVHHAHQRGILHRDLKPANILVDNQGEPHISDFGLAKRIEGDRDLTVSGAILGTPAYMSPEQASGQREAVTTASDIYGLGATLYALLTGRAPFSGGDVMEILQAVRDRAPIPPSSLKPRLSRDLEIVCLKCLEKDPRRRYATAGDLATDLRRWLADEPIAARPAGRLERAWRWCRRKPVIAGLSAAVAALILIVAVAGPIAALREGTLRREAEQSGYEARIETLAATEALVRSHHSQSQQLHHANEAGRQQKALDLLGQAGELRGRTDELVEQLRDDPKGWRARVDHFWRDRLPDLRTEAVRWLALASLQPVSPVQFPVDPSEPTGGQSDTGLALSPDGATLAFLHAAPREGRRERPGRVEIVDTATGRVAGGFDLGPGHLLTAVALAFDATGRQLAIARGFFDGRMPGYVIEHRAWPTGEVRSTVRLRRPGPSDPGLALGYIRLAFSPDLRHLLTIPRTVLTDAPLVWDVADGRPVRVLDRAFWAQAFSASGDQVIGGKGPEIQFVSIATGAVTRRLTLPDGRLGPGRDNDPFRSEPQPDSRPGFGYHRFINATTAPRLVPSPDGKWLVATLPGLVLLSNPPQFGISVLLFEVASGEVRGHVPLPPLGNTHGTTGFLPLLAFGGGGRWLAALTARQVVVASVPDGTPLHVEELPVTRVALPADPQPTPRGIGGEQLPLGIVADRTGTRLVSAADDSLIAQGQRFGGVSRPEPAVKHQIVQVWDLAEPRLRPEARFFRGAIRSVKIGSGGQVVAGGDDRAVHSWRPGGPVWAVGYPGPGALYESHAANWEVFGRGEVVRYGRFDPSGRVFVTRLPDRVELWDAEAGRLRQSFPASNLVEEWDATTGRLREVLHPRHFLALARDASALAINDQDERGQPVIRLLDVGRDAWTLTIPERMSRAGFAPDSRHFVAQRHTDPTGGRGSILVLADAVEGKIIARIPFGQRWWFGPGGKRVTIYGYDGATPTLRVFELATGRSIGELGGMLPDLGVSSNSLEIWFSPDGEQLALLIGQRPPGRYQEESRFATWRIGRTEATPIGSRWMGNSGSAAAFARGGTRLVLSDSKVEVWDITDGREPNRLIAADQLYSLSKVDRPFLLDDESGRLLTCHGVSDTRVSICVIWDIITGRELERPPGRETGVTGGGRLLLLQADPHGRVQKLVPWAGGAGTMTIQTASVPFVGLYGRTVVAETDDAGRSVGLWDLGSARQRGVLEGQAAVLAPRDSSHGDPVVRMPGYRQIRPEPVVSPDGRLLVTQSTSGPAALNLVELSTGKVERSIPFTRPAGAGGRPILDCSFDAAGRHLAFNVNDRYRILDLESGRVLALGGPGHRGAVRSVDVSRDGGLVASGSDDGTIVLRSAATGRLAATLEEGSVPIREIDFSPAGDRLAARDADGRLRVWKLDRSAPGAGPEVAPSLLWTASATAMAFSSDGALVAAGRGDGATSLLGADDGRIVKVLVAGPDTGAVRALAAEPGGSMLAAGSDDGSVRLWDMSRAMLAARWAIGPAPIRALAFGKGGLLGISAGGVEVWDTRRGERLLNLERHSRLVNTLGFSPDGRVLASGSDDQSVALWNLDAYSEQLGKLHLGW
jgi:WD40 repeat protein/tRNA A-37 threonylcarbamoyl transferase component Bud32